MMKNMGETRIYLNYCEISVIEIVQTLDGAFIRHLPCTQVRDLVHQQYQSSVGSSRRAHLCISIPDIIPITTDSECGAIAVFNSSK